MASPSLLPEASTITLTELQSTLALYEPLLMHLTLEDRKKVQKTGGLSGDFLSLDMQRFVQLPGMPNRTSMSKKEVTYAMDWKLKHGTNRPSLSALLAQNSEDFVESTTESAFALYKSDPGNYAAPMKKLAELKGIGPATSSLLLSICDLDNAPFFSDELFRWVCWDEAQGGWKRKIRYDMKEYGILWDGVKDLRERLGKEVKAVELEKCAFVCGRLRVNQKLEVEIRAEAEKMRAKEKPTGSKQGPGPDEEATSSSELEKGSEKTKAIEEATGSKQGIETEEEATSSIEPKKDSMSLPAHTKNAKGNKSEPKAIMKSSERSSSEAEIEPESNKASTSPSPPKKQKTEKTNAPKKPAKKPTTAAKEVPNIPAADKRPAPAEPKSGGRPATKASAKESSKKSNASAPSVKANGGENGRVLRPRKTQEI